MAHKKNNPPSSKHNPDGSENRGSYRFMSVAIEVVLLNLIFIWGGIKLDEIVHEWSPTFLIVGVVFATAGTIYYLLVKLNR